MELSCLIEIFVASTLPHSQELDVATKAKEYYGGRRDCRCWNKEQKVELLEELRGLGSICIVQCSVDALGGIQIKSLDRKHRVHFSPQMLP